MELLKPPIREGREGHPRGQQPPIDLLFVPSLPSAQEYQQRKEEVCTSIYPKKELNKNNIKNKETIPKCIFMS